MLMNDVQARFRDSGGLSGKVVILGHDTHWAIR